MSKLCYGCMKETDSTSFCPHCGYDQQQSNPSNSIPAGVIIHGQYLIGRVLGQTYFHYIYLGYDIHLERPVVIKEYFLEHHFVRKKHSLSVIYNPFSLDFNYKDQLDRFITEAREMARIGTLSSTPSILNLFEENNTTYVVLEIILGMDLRKYLRETGHPLTLEETLTILDPVMDTLSRAHEAQLLHRQITPDNIFIRNDGNITLLNFCDVQPLRSQEKYTSAGKYPLNFSTFRFSPKEQLMSSGIEGPWTDVYSLCATIYYCLTLSVPPGPMERIVDDSIWDKLSGLTPQQLTALQKGMAIQAKDRIQSIQELRSALNK